METGTFISRIVMACERAPPAIVACNLLLYVLPCMPFPTASMSSLAICTPLSVGLICEALVFGDGMV